MDELKALVKSGSSKNPSDTSWAKRGDLDKRKAEEYLKNKSDKQLKTNAVLQQPTASNSVFEVSKRRRISDCKDSSASKELKGIHRIICMENTTSVSVDLDLSEVDLRILCTYLRELNEPSKLFGETHSERVMRCREAFKRTVLDTGSKERSSSRDPKPIEISESILLRITSYTECAVPEISQTASWFHKVLNYWMRSIHVMRSESGLESRNIYTKFVQTTECLTNLLGLLKSGTLDRNVLARIFEIARLCDNLSYHEANAEYMKLSIGNQAWVIGVGNCFIQERSSNDKIREAVHLLNDEAIRDSIQCIKRLITRSEQYWPSTK